MRFVPTPFSPLLANIGLHGLETYIKATNSKLGVVRYADDFIVTARDKESLEIAQNLIQAWMSKRSLELSAEKTAITSMEGGFDFLGSTPDTTMENFSSSRPKRRC